MVGAEVPLRQSRSVKRLGLGTPALRLVEHRQLVRNLSVIAMVGTKSSFLRGAFVQSLGLAIPAWSEGAFARRLSLLPSGRRLSAAIVGIVNAIEIQDDPAAHPPRRLPLDRRPAGVLDPEVRRHRSPASILEEDI
jgi:hypothetical protein